MKMHGEQATTLESKAVYKVTFSKLKQGQVQIKKMYYNIQVQKHKRKKMQSKNTAFNISIFNNMY